MSRVGVPFLEQLEAIVANEAVYEIAKWIPEGRPDLGGRPRHYPTYMYVLYDALISVFGSARRVDTELGHPRMWGYLRDLIRQRFPKEPAKWLQAKPIRRHYWLYARTTYLADAAIFDKLMDRFRETAAVQAQEMGMCLVDGPGSWTHPDLSRVPYADGKVITPPYKAKEGDTRLDKRTGELRMLRADPDAGLHQTGDGQRVFGNKFVIAACRTSDHHGRVILDFAHVGKAKGGEPAVAVECFARIAPLLPGAQGVLYDGAFRGKHMQRLLNQLGLIPIAPVMPEKGGKTTGQPAKTRLVAFDRERRLAARGGVVGIVEYKENGDPYLRPLELCQIIRRANADGTYRWYGDYAEVGLVRLDTTDEDRKRKFNRTENVRAIPPASSEYRRLYPRRADIESINRHLDDTMWLGRAHSVGAVRQTVDLLGFALAVNSVALHRHRKRQAPPNAQAA